MELSMDALASFTPTHELPVTLVCAGNRRKEQNMIRKTAGFNYGAAAASTNVYKGVRLCDLLRDLLGIDVEQLLLVKNAKAASKLHVEFLGAEDLPNKVGTGPFAAAGGKPWGHLVKFGTSIPLVRAMNPAFDVLVAYEANGERLQPDHGAPVRLVIPGYVAGRSIKWLQQINILEHETHNHWHYVSIQRERDECSLRIIFMLSVLTIFPFFSSPLVARQSHLATTHYGRFQSHRRLVVRFTIHLSRNQSKFRHNQAGSF